MRTVLAAAMLVTVGCNGIVSGDRSDGGVEASGSASVYIASVPANVGCVVINDSASRYVSTSFTVTPGSTARLTMNDLPTGTSQFDAVAYAARCPAAAGAVPTWATASPTTAVITAGGVTSLSLSLAPAGAASIGLNFVDGGAGGDGGR